MDKKSLNVTIKPIKVTFTSLEIEMFTFKLERKVELI